MAEDLEAPLFAIDGPDEEGEAWLTTRDGRQVRLGAWESAAEIMADWMAGNDFGERA
jgi:hypothetical protein